MQFKEELNDLQKLRKRHEVDIQLIASDIAQRAVETTIKNIDYADIQALCEADLVEPRKHAFINDPLILSSHWPKPFTRSESGAITQLGGSPGLINF